ncbi:MAG TPA: AraC family transcriptional regulator [Coleofasciculaceae cyanobacterium]|jgi:AraC-like DNA-binding protein
MLNVKLRPGLELSIEHYQLHDRWNIPKCDEALPPLSDSLNRFEMCFQISRQNCDRDGFMGAGQTTFCASGLAVSGEWEQLQQHPVMSVSMHIEPELVVDFWGEDDRDIDVNWNKLFQTEQPCFVDSGSITPQMQVALQQILNCPYRGAIARMYLESKVWELMALQLAQMKDDNRSNQYSLKSEDRDRLYLAQQILGDRLDHPPSLTDLAQEIGLNECSLKRGFRQLFGTTVFGYLYQQRMEYARQLLQQRELNVGQVAKKVGYASQSRFATAFRKKFGINPKVFARRSLGNLTIY